MAQEVSMVRRSDPLDGEHVDDEEWSRGTLSGNQLY